LFGVLRHATWGPPWEGLPEIIVAGGALLWGMGAAAWGK